jgi:hypothetical protein
MLLSLAKSVSVMAANVELPSWVSWSEQVIFHIYGLQIQYNWPDACLYSLVRNAVLSFLETVVYCRSVIFVGVPDDPHHIIRCSPLG